MVQSKIIKKIGVKTAAALVISAMLVTTTPSTSMAQTPEFNMQISPVSNKIELTPCETYKGEVTLSNVGSASFGFKTYPAPYTPSEPSDFETTRDDTEMSEWISFYNAGDFNRMVEAGEEKNIEYVINVPRDAKPGAQRAVVFFESGNNHKVNRLGFTILANVGTSNERCDVGKVQTTIAVLTTVSVALGALVIALTTVVIILLVARKNSRRRQPSLNMNSNNKEG